MPSNAKVELNARPKGRMLSPRESALSNWPDARNFEPARSGVRRELFGWTFEVPGEGSGAPSRYGWITNKGWGGTRTFPSRDSAKQFMKDTRF